MTDIMWPLLPPNIPGVDYDKLKECNKLYNSIKEYIDNFDKYQNDKIKFIRITPPYTEKCSFDNPKCIKAGSFIKKSDKKYFCWFHVNCCC